jgi:DnaJ domain/PASTA domain
MADRITWYDILGISPGASSDTVRRAYRDKAQYLERDWIAGAPPKVIEAAVRGRKTIDAAWRILGDPAERQRYDEQIGIAHRGAGLAGAEPAPSRPGLDSTIGEAALGAVDPGDVTGALDPGDVTGALAAVLTGLGALAAWLAPAPRTLRHQSREVTVPDVRGLFARPCQEALVKAGFRISTIRLTSQPMPVEGLVVDQSPAPGEKVPRLSTLAIQIWHPPRRQSPW